jgi:Trk-type K+ transport system membrane component
MAVAGRPHTGYERWQRIGPMMPGERPVLTATGSTVITGLDGAPMGILLWRWLLTWLGLSFEASLGGSATALGGVGPGLGPLIGPCCTFAPLPDSAKWLLTLEMLAGRLEILVLMIPLTRTFWRG